MSSMRWETHRTGVYVVRQLQATGATIVHDGGDIILVEFVGHKVSIHLIESELPLYELKTILRTNAQDGIHTLLVFWCDAFVPDDGAPYEPDELMAAVLALHGGKLYTFTLYGSEVFIFPVYFNPSGTRWRVRHGETIERMFLECQAVSTTLDNFTGVWQVADFSPQPSEAWWKQQRQQQKEQSAKAVTSDRATMYYAILGVTKDDNAAAIKRAYRVLARKHHPDLNASLDSTERMQAINEAYAWIIQQVETNG